MNFHPFSFSAALEFNRHDETYSFHLIHLPDDLAKQLPLKDNPRLRITGEINGKPIEAALNPSKGRWSIHVSKRLMKSLNVETGDTLSFEFAIADQDAVNVPRALRNALDEMPDLKDIWNSLTPGKRRSMAYRVASAKTKPTIQKRISDILTELAGLLDPLHFPPNTHLLCGP